jgi:hypothetical protein
VTEGFQYRPKFVDIRVRPPKPGEAPPEKADVFTLKPGERPCEHAGCRRAASAKAPKGRGLEGEFYNFCAPHAAEYNKNWNYFAGMTEAEVAQWQVDDRTTGHRPTWAFKASSRSREAAAAAAKAGEPFADPLGVFAAAKKRADAAQVAESARPMGKLERVALADLGLDMRTEPAAIRARYHELIKRLHPDTNGGDRSTEEKLGRVIRAYKTLKAAKLA